MTDEEKYMKIAIKEAKKSLLNNEVPVGAIIVKDGKIIARAYNKKEKCHDATCHAEVIAIRKASKKLGDWRLQGADMYVTLEPCVMCGGAIVSSRIKRVFFGAYDFSGNLSGAKVFENSFMNHKTDAFGGVLKSECEKLLKDFFVNKRK